MKSLKSKTIIIILALIFFNTFSQFIYADEVPEDRTIYIYAPFYFDFKDQGEKTLNDLIHYYHNYEIFDQHIEDAEPNPSPVNTSLTKLITQLERTTPKWGIILIDSHGGEGGWLAVEAYTDKDMRDNKITEYIASGIPDDDIDPAFASGCYIIIISSNYLSSHTSQMGNKTIVFGNFCYSDSLANAFVNGGKVYNFFGFDKAVSLSEGLYTTETLFKRLGGEIDEKRNYTANEAMVGMPGYFKHVTKNTDAEKQVVYNSPKILQLKITQGEGANERTIYDYSYSDLIYPFLDAPYVVDPALYQKSPAVVEDIKIKIRFSETIDWDANQISVKYDPQGESAGAGAVNFTNGTWSKTFYDYDTWEGTANIPANQSGYEGLSTIIVRARDAFQKDASSTNANGELDTNGDGKFDGLDTLHNLTTPDDFSAIV